MDPIKALNIHIVGSIPTLAPGTPLRIRLHVDRYSDFGSVAIDHRPDNNITGLYRIFFPKFYLPHHVCLSDAKSIQMFPYLG